MDNKTKQEIREYQRGYHDGREGNSYNDGSDPFIFAVTGTLLGGPRSGADAYSDGFKDGKKDR